MISEHDAQILLRSAIYAFCRQKKFLIMESSEVTASYTFSGAELRDLEHAKIADSIQNWFEETANRLNESANLQGDLDGLKMLTAHLLVSMGGSVVFDVPEIQSMMDAKYELAWHKDARGRIILEARSTRD